MNENDRVDEATVGQFYDSLWSSGLSTAALAHGADDVGQECLLTPREIGVFAQRAGIASGTQVLDIGSGRGGPACYLARQLGCRVVGVDISTVGHAQAIARARDEGLGHLVEFRLGGIHAVELPHGAFDVVLGLDAWCHIPRRGELLKRCAAWLRPGGRLAFYDHVELRPMPAEQRQRFCTIWRFAGLETPRSYVAAVGAAGLRLLSSEETSAYTARFYTRILEGYQEHRAEFEAARGPERYREGLERLKMTRKLAVTGVLGQLACIAENPGRA